MDEKRWLQIEEILQQALDLEPHQRAAFLKQACKNEPTLLAKVEALLEREHDAGSFMESPAVAHLLHQISRDPPSHISHYQIEARIGAGGMGEVYRAHSPLLVSIIPTSSPYLKLFIRMLTTSSPRSTSKDKRCESC